MRPQSSVNQWRIAATVAVVATVGLLTFGLTMRPVSGQSAKSGTQTIKGQAIAKLLSTGGLAARQVMRRRAKTGVAAPKAFAGALDEPEEDPGEGLIPTNELGLGTDYVPPGQSAGHGNGRVGANVFVNDPCLDPAPTAPFPTNFQRTVQSETEIAVLNQVDDGDDDHDGHHGGDHDRGDSDTGDHDKGDHDRSANDDHDDEGDASGTLMVAGYNDSAGFYDNTQGLSGYSYSTDGGKSWIDGGGLPPLVPSGAPAGTLGSDAYFGDPVVVVHHRSKVFYYASIYQQADGIFTLAVNRGRFKVAPPQGIESKANTRCAGDPTQFGVPDPPAFIRKRIIWEPPVVAVPVFDPGDFLDKEWLYVDQRSGELYLAYVRFGADGSTPIELVRSMDGGHTWTPPSVIVPNLADTFNTSVQPITTPTGRVIVSWIAQTFALVPPDFPEVSERVEEAYSDNDGATFSSPVLVARVNPQGEPPGYNRGRTSILNVPYIAVDKGTDDGRRHDEDRARPGYGNVYITYFDGVTRLPATTPIASAAEIHLSRSTNDGTSWGPEIKVNDDKTPTSHVFSSVQVNRHGTVFVTWIDRRVDPVKNLLNDTWAAFSTNRGSSFGTDIRVTDVSTDWLARADARPNFGDYNSSAVIDFEAFASIWSDGRFPPGTFVDRRPPPTPPLVRRAATPDSFFAIVGNGSSGSGDHDDH